MKLSARNQLKGKVVSIEKGAVNAIVGIEIAGGDIVTGAATVILAMGAGKKAAAAIDDYLQGKREASAK